MLFYVKMFCAKHVGLRSSLEGYLKDFNDQALMVLTSQQLLSFHSESYMLLLLRFFIPLNVLRNKLEQNNDANNEM